VRKWFVTGTSVALALTAVVVQPTFAEGEEERVLEVGKWYPSLESGLQITQSSYSDNWSGGDKGSIVWTALINGNAERQVNDKFNSLSTLKLAYGQTQKQFVDQWGDRKWEHPEKSTDLVDLESIGRFTLDMVVDPFVGLRIETQFLDGSDPDGRTLIFNPIKIKESAGVARVFIDEEERSLISRFGLAVRQTARRQYIVASTGDSNNPATDSDTETEVTNDGGIELVTDFKNKIMNDRVAWTSKLTLFQPLFYSAQGEFDDITAEDFAANPQLDSDIGDFTKLMDLDWENIFTSQLTDIVSVNFYVRFVYDKYDTSVVPKFDEDGGLTNAAALRTATRKAGQFKQTMGLGLTYRFL